MIDAIYNRRSIRKYKDQPVPDKIMEQILTAGIQAPSAKNRQPWKFIIITEKSKSTMLKFMKKGLENEVNNRGILNNSKQHIAGAEYSVKIMEQAPVNVFIVNTLGHDLFDPIGIEDKIYETANIESISAAIQNMSLAATDLGIGSLWICDIYFAYRELNKWLNADGQIIAAMTFGYPDEQPGVRPRKKLKDVVEWR